MEGMELKDLKIKKGRWLLFWSNNLKTASLLHAVHGIIISVVLLLLMYFFRDYLLRPYFCDDIGNILYCIKWNQDFAYGVLMGIIFLFYSIILLYKTYSNDRHGVFTMIKIGCIIQAVVDILYVLVKLIVAVMIIIRWAEFLPWSDIDTSMKIVVKVIPIMILLLTMVIFAIIRGNSKIVTCYYFIRLFLILPLGVVLFYHGFHYQNCLLFVGLVWLIFYHVMFFVLQVNVIFHTNTLNSRDQNFIG